MSLRPKISDGAEWVPFGTGRGAFEGRSWVLGHK